MKTLTISLSCLLSVALASPATASNTVLKENVKGDSANASFGQDTEITCEDGSIGNSHVGITLLGSKFTSRSDFSDDVRQNQVEVFVFTRNTCTFEEGVGFAAITDPKFKISAQNRASLQGTATVADFFTGVTIGTVTFNLTLTGVGTVSRSVNHQRLEFDNITFILHSVGSFRNATPAGTITFNGIDFMGGFTNASLGKTRSGAVELISD